MKRGLTVEQLFNRETLFILMFNVFMAPQDT